MNKPILTLLLLLPFLHSRAQTPVVAWQQLFDNGPSVSPGTGANRVIPAIGGGYMVCGFLTNTSGPGAKGGSADAWATVYNDTGAIVWQKAFGGSGSDNFTSVKQSSDHSGYIFAGRTTSNDGDVKGNHGTNDAWVVRTDDTGKILWQKCYGGSGQDGFHSPFDGRSGYKTMMIEPLEEGGYLFSTSVASNDGDVSGNHGLKDLWVVRIDDTGKILWQKCYGGTGNEYSSGDIFRTADDGFIIGGSTESNNGDVTGFHGMADFWVIKIDNTGTLKWQKALGGSGAERGISGICPAPDGGYIMSGTSQSADGDVDALPGGTAYQNWWVVKINDTGAIEWNRSYGNVGRYTVDVLYSIKPAIGGGYLLGGSVCGADDFGTGIGADATVKGPIEYGDDFWLVKIGDTGSLIWEKNYYIGASTPGGLENIRDVLEQADGSIVAVGGANNYTNWWTAKFFACPAYTPVADTICAGHSFSFGGKTYTHAGRYVDTLIMFTTGCDSLIQLTLAVDTIPKPIITAGTAGVFNTGAYTTYQWLKDSVVISGANAATFTALLSGKYNVVVTNPRGCTDTSDAYDYILTSIHEPAIFAGLKVYPNPATDLLVVDLPQLIAGTSLELYSIDGRVLQTELLATTKYQLDLNKFAPGIYFIKIGNKEGAAIRKITKH